MGLARWMNQKRSEKKWEFYLEEMFTYMIC